VPQRGAGGITGRSSLDERPGDDAGALDWEFALELVIHKGDVIPDVLEVGHLCNILGIISHRGVGLLSIFQFHTRLRLGLGLLVALAVRLGRDGHEVYCPLRPRPPPPSARLRQTCRNRAQFCHPATDRLSADSRRSTLLFHTR